MAEERETAAPKFPPDVEERLNAIRERQSAIEAERANRAEALRLPPSHEDMIRAEEAKLAAMEREEADEKAWLAALAKHGKGRVARVTTPDGIIVLRCMTLSEQDECGARLDGLDNQGQRLTVSREMTLDTVVYPARDVVRDRTSKYPGVWTRLYAARDALAVGEVDTIMGKA